MTMLPREQVVTVQLDAGLDTGTDPQTSTAMAVAANVVHPRRGAIAKRAGQARSAAAVGASSAPSRISRLGDSAVVWGGTAVHQYSPAADVAYAASYDATERAMQSSTRRIGDALTLTSLTTSGSLAPSLALGDSIVAVVYGSMLATYARSSLMPIDSFQYRSMGSDYARVVRRPDGQILAIDGSGSGIAARVIGTDGIIGSPVVMTATSTDALSVAVVGADVYVLARCTIGIVLGRLAGGSPAAWTQATIDAIGGVTSHGPGLGLAGVAGGVAVAWSRLVGSSRSVATAVYDATLSQVVTVDTVVWSTTGHPQQIAVIGAARQGSAAGTIATVYAAGSVGSAAPAVATDRRKTSEYAYVATAGVGSYDATSDRERYGAVLAAAPMLYSATEWYVPWYSEAWGATYPDASTHQGLVVVSGCGVDPVAGSLDSSHYRPVAAVASGYARQPVGTVAPVPSDAVQRVAGDASQGWAMLVQTALRDVPGTQRGDVLGLRLVEVWPSSADGATIEHGGSVLVPGALPRETDGVTVYEQGWLQYPEPIVHASSSAGSLTPGAQYRYVATYEHIDALGRRHMSAPTPIPATVTPTSASDALPTLQVATLAHSLRGRRAATSGTRRAYGSLVRVVIWRTMANGSIYYRLNDVWNDYTISYQSFSIGMDVSDATISNAEVLPTTGGVLAAAPPPPYVAQTMWQGRHVVVDADRQELRYSRATAVGAPIQHALELAQPLRLDGTVTALDAIGGRLIIMTDRAIYATDGAGYDDIGQGQPLADPYLISSLVGCSDARSVARLPQGIAFLGGSRIWLLDSGLALQPIGEPVRYYTESSTYRDAVPLQSRTSIAWTSATGPALVYDAVHGRWSTWDTHACVGACATSSGVLRLASDYRVWRPAADTAGDDGAWVTMDLATGWLAIADWQRVAEIEVSGYYVSRCAIRLRVQYDYVPVDVDDATYTPAASGLLVSPSIDHWGAGLGASYLDRALRIAHAPSRTQCSALRVRITDAREGSEALGAGAEWSTVRVRLQAEAGVQRLDRSRRTG